jgi:fructuronate reductase
MRLTNATLETPPPGVAAPRYRRAAVRPGIVHLGIGAFHRAHQAVYTDAALADDPTWGIVGVSLRSPETCEALGPQDGLFTVVDRDRDGDRFQIVGSVVGCLVAPSDPAAVLSALAAPETRIVSLTVTEKGYCWDAARGELDEDHPDIRRDLANVHRPRTAPGFIAAAVRLRRERGLPPFAVLSCDNLPSNGRTTRAVLARFAELADPALGAFVAEHLACPSTMVDRIVPKTTDADRALVSDRTGYDDAWPVMTERFSQWVIEDRFPLGRPEWDRAGAEFVDDVEPYELMKLRLLNGSHSTLAYLGLLAGHEIVASAIGDERLRAFALALMRNELAPTLSMPSGTDVEGYIGRLIERFDNPAIRHRLIQIASDGSQKLPQRLVRPARERLGRGEPIDRIAVAVAAFIRVWGLAFTGRPEIEPLDPLAGRLRTAIERGASATAGPVAAVLGIGEIFGELGSAPAFAEPVFRAYSRLVAGGPDLAVEGLC